MKQKTLNGFNLIYSLIKMRWVSEIIKSISYGNNRYNQILNSIPQMSHTELNRKLNLLLNKKVINKEDNNYILLDFGKDLIHIFNHLEELEEKYLAV